MDLSSAITTATSSATTQLTTNLAAVFPYLAGFAIAGAILRKVVGAMRRA